jgi:hypothetical protein
LDAVQGGSDIRAAPNPLPGDAAHSVIAVVVGVDTVVTIGFLSHRPPSVHWLTTWTFSESVAAQGMPTGSVGARIRSDDDHIRDFGTCRRGTSRLLDAGVDASVGSVGDAYDNALAEASRRSLRTSRSVIR